MVCHSSGVTRSTVRQVSPQSAFGKLVPRTLFSTKSRWKVTCFTWAARQAHFPPTGMEASTAVMPAAFQTGRCFFRGYSLLPVVEGLLEQQVRALVSWSDWIELIIFFYRFSPCGKSLFFYLFLCTFNSAFFRFSANRNCTILRIKSIGIGLSIGNLIDPFAPSYMEISFWNSRVPLGVG
jgi:hypothetical protein